MKFELGRPFKQSKPRIKRTSRSQRYLSVICKIRYIRLVLKSIRSHLDLKFRPLYAIIHCMRGLLHRKFGDSIYFVVFNADFP